MIRFDLRCDEGHAFDSWFASSDAFEDLRGGGHVACPACGSAKVEKALMAPRVRPSRKAAQAPEPQAHPDLPVAAAPAPGPEIAEAIAKLRRHIETNSADVGSRFAAEARAMHLGDAPARAIHGQASGQEARELIEDGVPVLPLPFDPKSRAN